MRLVRPSYQILTEVDGEAVLRFIELAGRTCYKSEDRMTPDSARRFVKMLMTREHVSVIEHVGFSVKFVCDRGVTHEIVRHRLAAYSQESTRYCNYKGGVTFVIPPWCAEVATGEYVDWDHGEWETGTRKWARAMHFAEMSYSEMLECGWTPQQARSVLPNSTKTEIVMTCNLREWWWVFHKRTAKDAHPQMREVMCPLLADIRKMIPIIYDGVGSIEV